jgi:hypothetical protein
MWTLYGQLAIPAFVIEQKGIMQSLALSFHRSNRVLWTIIEVGIAFGVLTLVIVGLIQGGIYIGESGTISTISTALWKVFESKSPLMFVGLEFPILTLAYVYIYKYAQQKSELTNKTKRP